MRRLLTAVALLLAKNKSTDALDSDACSSLWFFQPALLSMNCGDAMLRRQYVYVEFYLCTFAFGLLLHSNSVSFSTCVYEKEKERERESERPIPLLCLCVNLCNRILNRSSVLVLFFLSLSLTHSLSLRRSNSFSPFLCLYCLIALFFRSIQTVAAAAPSPSPPFFSSRSVLFIHLNMKIYSSILFIDDDATSRQKERERETEGESAGARRKDAAKSMLIFNCRKWYETGTDISASRQSLFFLNWSSHLSIWAHRWSSHLFFHLDHIDPACLLQRHPLSLIKIGWWAPTKRRRTVGVVPWTISVGIDRVRHRHRDLLSVRVMVWFISRHRQRWAHGALTLIVQQTDRHPLPSHQTSTTLAVIIGQSRGRHDD